MPHILVTQHKSIQTPLETLSGVRFNYIVKNNYEEKIAITYKKKDFLLTKINKNENILIKADSTTRVTPVGLIKDAIKEYSKNIDAKILFSNIENSTTKLAPQDSYLKPMQYFLSDDYKKNLQQYKQVCIEVGFGSGRHLLYQASQNPDILYIGLEIHTASIEKMLKQVRLLDITNILAVNYDARLFLEFIQSNSISRIFVHFPVPWDKKPHRRVMSIEFIKESLRVLEPNGTLELRTDSPNYYEYSSNLYKQFNNKYTIDKNKELAISSKYEDRWKKQGKDIWDLTIYSDTISNDIIIEPNFIFDFKYNIKDFKDNLPKKPIVKTDYFVHFSNIFTNDNLILIELTMGSFNKPLSKFIVISQNTIYYFQDDPIPTSANKNAHNLIVEKLKETLI